MSFNPRSHMGSDAKMAETWRKEFVSIHAPTWGATEYGNGYHDGSRVSIHAPTWGATLGRQGNVC